MEEAVKKVGSIQGAKDDTSLLQVKPPTSPPPTDGTPTPNRVYRWRWVVLAIFVFNNLVTNYIWIMSAIVADLMVCYYGITDTLLNFSTTSYMMVYTIFMLPATWFMDRYGLRLPTVLGSAVMALGASIRVIGTGMYCIFIA
jgi:MFS family permease